MDYSAVAKVGLLNSNFQLLKALFGFITYFELPEMYTTSLFKRDIIEETKKIQGGVVFVTHPQDANLAAIACRLEKRYVFSSIPLGWVGTSPKSAGIAVVSDLRDNTKHNESVENLKREYLHKTKNSKLKTNPAIGDFSFGSPTMYLWGALLETKNLRVGILNKILTLKIFKIIILGSVLVEVYKNKKFNVDYRLSKFKEIASYNNCNLGIIRFVSIVFQCLYPANDFFMKVVRKLEKVRYSSITFKAVWKESPETTIITAFGDIDKLIQNKKMLVRI